MISSLGIIPNLGLIWVKKDNGLLHTRNCRNQAGTTISEDLELWNQLCRLQLPSKILLRAELRNI